MSKEHRRLIQLIGPQGCGKSLLRRYLCPGAIGIDQLLIGSVFNAPMIGAPGFYFEEARTRTAMNRLKEWVMADEIHVHVINRPPQVIPNPGIWIYMGFKPIDFEPSLIWRVQKQISIGICNFTDCIHPTFKGHYCAEHQ